MTATMTVDKAIKQIQSQAESIKNDAPQTFPEAASPGDTFRQGDIYITLLDRVPDGAVKIMHPLKQLAPGTTQGSRHCLDSMAGVKMFRLAAPTQLDGPVIVTTKPRTITHPEHGDVALPAGCYGIRYQRDLDAEERERRVQD
jgi:hypothetical protein